MLKFQRNQKSGIAKIIDVLPYLSVLYIYFSSKAILLFLEQPFSSIIWSYSNTPYVDLIYVIITPPATVFVLLGFFVLFDWIRRFRAYRPIIHVFLASGLYTAFSLISSLGLSVRFDSLYSFSSSSLQFLFLCLVFVVPLSSAFTYASPYRRDSNEKGFYKHRVLYGVGHAEAGALSISQNKVEGELGSLSFPNERGKVSVEQACSASQEATS